MRDKAKTNQYNDELRSATNINQRLEDELQEALEESRQRNEIISALVESSRAVSHQREFQKTAQVIYDSCKRLIGATIGFVALVADEGDEPEILFFDTGEAGSGADHAQPMPIRGIREEVYLSGKTTYENDLSNSDWITFFPQGHSGLDNALFAPLMIKGIAVGLLGLANKPGGFCKDDARIASIFGEQIAIAFLNSRALETLQNSEERFRSVAQSASEAIIILDSQGIIEYWNKAASTIFGYPPEEAINKPLSFIMPERFRERHHRGLERVVATGETRIIGKTIEMTGLRKNGHEFPVELSLSSWKFGGENFFSGIIRDISERKQAMHEIQSLARFPSENRNPVMRVSQDGSVIYANKASTPLLTFWDCQVGQKLPDTWSQLVAEVNNSAENRTIDVNCDGRVFSLDLAPVVEAGYITLYGKDITDRKQAETLLNEQNQFMMTVFESLNYPFYVVDASDYTIKMANSAARLSEFPVPASCYSVIHGRNTPCSEAGELCPLEEIKKIKRSVITEHVHYDRQGNRVTYDVHAHPIFDSQGNVIQIIEYALDTTERKRMEQALRESEAKWRSLTQNSPDHIMMLDTDLNIRFVNYASPGLTQDELLGVALWKFVAEERQSEIKESLENVLKTGEPDRYETEYNTPDGNTIYYESHVVPMKVDDNLNGLILSARDITERKQMEDALRERTHALDERVKELNCLYSIAALVEEPYVSLQEILQGTVDLIPPSWQYPEITGARIILGEQKYKTMNFSEASPWKQVEDIVIYGQREGKLEVCYLAEKPESDEGPFLKEERSLLNAITGRLNRIIERMQAEEALQKAHIELELRVQERTAELKEANQALQAEIIERRRAYEAEQDARQVSETLRTASQALTRTLNLDTVMSTLLDYLGRLVPCDSANVALLGDESCLIVRAERGFEGGKENQLVLPQSYNIEDNSHIQQIFKTGKSILISDTRHHPNWKPYLDLEDVVNWLGLPIEAADKIIGLCSLDKDKPGFFTQEHVQLAEALVSQAAVAIQNAWLFEQVHTGRERLQSLSRRLVEVQENERRYIARELHDEAGQALTSLKVGLSLLERDANCPEAVVAGTVELKHKANAILENLHRLAVDLRPASLDHLGLAPAIRQYLEAASDKHGLTVQFKIVSFDKRLPLDVESALYRIVQEAVTNVIRHAQATRVDVIIEQRGERLILIVEDNGIGFDDTMIVSAERLGIVGMRERAEMLGGELYVERTTGSGTAVFVEIPYDPSNSHLR